MRDEMGRYQSSKHCEVCNGMRLKPEALAVKIAKLNVGGGSFAYASYYAGGTGGTQPSRSHQDGSGYCTAGATARRDTKSDHARDGLADAQRARLYQRTVEEEIGPQGGLISARGRARLLDQTPIVITREAGQSMTPGFNFVLRQ